MEEWRDIKGYEGYQVSNLGDIKSLNYNYSGKERILVPIENKKHYRVVLKGDLLWVHRIVAFAFPEICGQYFEGAIINHKNENGMDNRAENLEWCTQKYNRNYGTSSQKLSEALTNRKDMSKEICQYDKSGNFVCEYPSSMEIQRQFGYRNSHITECCRGVRKTAYGYIWKFKKVG